jgi:chemotaxis protein CheX
MNSETLSSVFVGAVLDYFDTTVQQRAECGTPYMAIGRSPEVADYTGIIKVTGVRSGIVVFTAPKAMLCVMLMRMQETDMGHEQLCDLVGEVANTLCGNARRHLGHQFQISVPSVIHGRDSAIEYSANTRPIVIPIAWRSHHARLIVSMEPGAGHSAT